MSSNDNDDNNNNKKTIRSTPATQPGAVAIDSVEDPSVEEPPAANGSFSTTAEIPASSGVADKEHTTRSKPHAPAAPGYALDDHADKDTAAAGVPSIADENGGQYHPKGRRTKKKRTAKPATEPGAVSVFANNDDEITDAVMSPPMKDQSAGSDAKYHPKGRDVKKKRTRKPATAPGAVAMADTILHDESMKDESMKDESTKSEVSAPKGRARFVAGRSNNHTPNVNSPPSTTDAIATSKPGAVAVGGDNSTTSSDVLSSKERYAKGDDGRNARATATTAVVASNENLTHQQPGAISMTAIEGSVMVDKARMKERKPKRLAAEDPATMSDHSSLQHYYDDDNQTDAVIMTESRIAGRIPQPRHLIPGATRYIGNTPMPPSSGRTLYSMDNNNLNSIFTDVDTAAATAGVNARQEPHHPPQQTSQPQNASFVVVDVNDDAQDAKDEKSPSSLCSRRRWMILTAIVVLIIIIGGIIGGLMAGGDGDNNNDGNIASEKQQSDTPPPTFPPVTVAPSPGLTPASTVPPEEFNRWKSVITAASPKTSFLDETSGPNLALNWMRSDPYSANLEDALLLQRFALMTLWYSADGPNWPSVANWPAIGGNECQWIGIPWCLDDRFVLRLSMADPQISFNLSGNIPVELTLLSKLQGLELSTNLLTGTVPVELFSALTSLRKLSLSYNGLDGTIPTEIGRLSLLQTLSLNSNAFTGSLPTELNQLMDLETIFVNDNQLEGSIVFGEPWSKLGELLLSQNRLTGTIPTNIGFFTSLSSLALDQNSFELGLPSELGRLTKLVTFLASSANLSLTIPTEIGTLTTLERLVLSNNRFTGPVPFELGNLINLRQLSLTNTELTGSISDLACPSLPLQFGFRLPQIDCGEIECSCCSC